MNGDKNKKVYAHILNIIDKATPPSPITCDTYHELAALAGIALHRHDCLVERLRDMEQRGWNFPVLPVMGSHSDVVVYIADLIDPLKYE